MIHYTKQDIIRLAKEEDVEFIRLQFADVCGTLKKMAVTTGQLNMVLNNKCTFDGAAIDGFSDCVKSELFLVPDLDMHYNGLKIEKYPDSFSQRFPDIFISLFYNFQ